MIYIICNSASADMSKKAQVAPSKYIYRYFIYKKINIKCETFLYLYIKIVLHINLSICALANN